MAEGSAGPYWPRRFLRGIEYLAVQTVGRSNHRTSPLLCALCQVCNASERFEQAQAVSGGGGTLREAVVNHLAVVVVTVRSCFL